MIDQHEKFSYLATFGACIAVVAFAVNTLSQKVVQYYNCSTVVPGVVTLIPRCNNLTAYTIRYLWERNPP
jgi:hypothetical protein